MSPKSLRISPLSSRSLEVETIVQQNIGNGKSLKSPFSTDTKSSLPHSRSHNNFRSPLVSDAAKFRSESLSSTRKLAHSFARGYDSSSKRSHGLSTVQGFSRLKQSMTNPMNSVQSSPLSIESVPRSHTRSGMNTPLFKKLSSKTRKSRRSRFGR